MTTQTYTKNTGLLTANAFLGIYQRTNKGRDQEAVTRELSNLLIDADRRSADGIVRKMEDMKPLLTGEGVSTAFCFRGNEVFEGAYSNGSVRVYVNEAALKPYQNKFEKLKTMRNNYEWLKSFSDSALLTMSNVKRQGIRAKAEEGEYPLNVSYCMYTPQEVVKAINHRTLDEVNFFNKKTGKLSPEQITKAIDDGIEAVNVAGGW